MRDIIKIKSHEKLLTGNGPVSLSTKTSSALQDGITHVSSSRVKRNKKQRLAYKKRQKARKAQIKQNQPKAATASAPVKTDS